MALANSRSDREQAKFIERADGQTAVAVDLGAGSEINIDANSISTSGLVGKSSGGDFVTAYASATTIDCTSLPAYHATLLADDVISVVQVATGGGVTATYHRDDVVMTVATNTLTVTGAAFAASDTFVIYTNIQRETEMQGDTAHDAVDAGNPVGIGGIAAAAQRAAVAAGDRVKAVFNLFGEMVIAGYTWATNSIRTEEIDPLDQKYVAETLLALTNITTNTTGYGYIDMAGARFVGIQGETSGTTPTDVLTVTLEGTLQDDGTAPASCAYQDITTLYTGSASFVDTDFVASFDTVAPFKYVRVKYVTSNDSGADADLTVYTKKLY